MSSNPMVLVAVGVSLCLAACGSATRSASPQSPNGTVALTGASVGVRYERVLIAEHGIIAMVARDGCVATMASRGDQNGELEELGVRCPKPERLAAWFAGVDRITRGIAVSEAPDDDSDDDDVVLPTAELVTTSGTVMKVDKRADAERLIGAVHVLSAELASAEMPRPGPTSASGWQLLRVAGSAHVSFGGAPTTGILDARMSTNGQYLCEFVANAHGHPIRASKGGWISPVAAAKAIDDVLSPFADVRGGDMRSRTFASGIAGGAERRANTASTVVVFQRFARIQDALGDACSPELDSPADQTNL